MQTRKVILPRTFVQDRLDRDLSCGETRPIDGQRFECIVDDQTYADLLSDAQHQGWDTDRENRSIVYSARLAFKCLKLAKAPSRPFAMADAA